MKNLQLCKLRERQSKAYLRPWMKREAIYVESDNIYYERGRSYFPAA
jgi:hypothetical protein